MSRPRPLPRVEPDAGAPLVLVMDSASAVESMALVQGDLLVVSTTRRRPRGAGSQLPLDALALLERVGRSRPDALLVGVGPGAFTGLRVAIASALGLADGWGVPCGGFCSLRIWADALPGAVVVAADARRQEVYGRLFVDGAAQGPTDVLTPEALWARAAALPGPLTLVGDGARLHAASAVAALGARARVLPSSPDLGVVGAEAASALSAGGKLPPPRPVYLRDHAGGRVDGG